VPVDVEPDAVDVAELVAVEPEDVLDEDALLPEPEPELTAVDPPGMAVGTVEGCWAVFQVAVVGYGVLATVGEALS
jgi:hypothetical protein